MNHTVNGRNPVNSPVEVGSLSHYSQGFIPSRWFSPSSFKDHMGPTPKPGKALWTSTSSKVSGRGYGDKSMQASCFFSNTRLSSRCFPLIWFAQGTCGICLWCWVPFGNSWRLARCFQDEGARLIDLSKPHLCLIKVWEIRLIMVDQAWLRLIMIKVDYDDDFMNDSDLVGVGGPQLHYHNHGIWLCIFLMMMITIMTVDCSDAWCIPPGAGGA